MAKSDAESAAHAESEAPPAAERRSSNVDRRKYNRRATPSTVTPPYFETFERIAVALESIAQNLEQRQVRLPDVPARPRSSSDRS